MSGGLLTGAGTLTVTGQLTWTGGTMAGTGTTIAIGGLRIQNNNNAPGFGLDGARVLENRGFGSVLGYGSGINFNVGSEFGSGRFFNSAGATFTFHPFYDGYSWHVKYQSVDDDGSDALIDNAGTLIKAGTGSIYLYPVLANAGTIDVQGGTLSLQQAMTNAALLRIAPLATLAAGDFTNAADATLAFGLSTDGIGQLAATGTFTAGGTLRFEPLDGFEPGAGSSYGFASFDQLLGSFAQIDTDPPLVNVELQLDASDPQALGVRAVPI